MKKNVICKTIASLLLTAAMCINICTEFTANAQEAIEMQELSVSNLSNPKIEKDSSMEAEQKVTWDCVWFGRYPQAEVVPSANNYTAVDKSIL